MSRAVRPCCCHNTDHMTEPRHIISEWMSHEYVMTYVIWMSGEWVVAYDPDAVLTLTHLTEPRHIRMNESWIRHELCDINERWMSRVIRPCCCHNTDTYDWATVHNEWAIWHMNESWVQSHVNESWVQSHVNESWVQSHVNESWVQSHVNESWVKSHMREAWIMSLKWMSHVIWPCCCHNTDAYSHVTYEWVMSYVTCEWFMSHTYEWGISHSWMSHVTGACCGHNTNTSQGESAR